jgi:Bacterial protein of unknown function (DUF937)
VRFARDALHRTRKSRAGRPKSSDDKGDQQMATNLVSSIMQILTPDLIAKIARTLGIEPDVAQKVAGAAVPAILASFAGIAAKPAGAQRLSDTLEQQRPDVLSQITSAIGGPN